MNKKPIEHKGQVWLWGIVRGGYMKLSPEDAAVYRFAKRRREERKRAENPREVARREQENQRFMQGFKIVFAVDSLVKMLQAEEDPRLGEIFEVRRKAEEDYWKVGNDMIVAERLKGEAVLNYVDGRYYDLYSFLQNACAWLRKSQ